MREREERERERERDRERERQREREIYNVSVTLHTFRCQYLLLAFIV